MTTPMPVSKNAPVYVRQLEWPDPSQIADKEIAAAINECTRLRSAAEAAKGEAGEAAFKVEAAAAADQQREADHSRGKLKAKPKPTEPAARDAAQKAERAAAVAAIAANDAEGELLEVLAARGPALAQKVRDAAKAEVAAAHRAATEAREHLGQRAERIGLALWLDKPQSARRMASDLGSGLKFGPNQERSYSAIEALDAAIEATHDDPEPGGDPMDMRVQAAKREWRERREASTA